MAGEGPAVGPIGPLDHSGKIHRITQRRPRLGPPDDRLDPLVRQELSLLNRWIPTPMSIGHGDCCLPSTFALISDASDRTPS